MKITNKVILAVKIIEEIVKMHASKHTAASCHVVFDKQQYYFDIYESEVQKDSLNKMLRNASIKLNKGKR